MNVLGINCFAKNAAATLLVDGKIVWAAEEERFSRVKHDGWFPFRSIGQAMRESGLGLDDLDHVGFYMLPWRRFWGNGLSLWARHFPRAQTRFWQSFRELRLSLSVPKLLRRYHGGGGAGRFQFHNLEHHLCHAASAFYCSPFEDAVILTLDGAGEDDSCGVFVGEGNRIRRIRKMRYPNSPGHFYCAITSWLGFEPNSDEYKVMGLASYGEPKLLDKVRQTVRVADDGEFRMDFRYYDYPLGEKVWFSEEFVRLFGPARRPDEEVTPYHMDVAASFQAVLEEMAMKTARWAHRQFPTKNVCLAGGCALNCVLNGRVLREGPFERIFVQPASNDAGTSLGAALWVWNGILGKPRVDPLANVYLGPGYENDAIESVLRQSKLSYHRADDVARETAGLLADGKIVGWFQGRMEFGPRALGHRSILADPRRAEMKDLVNHSVKFREGFRPFAPSALAEAGPEYFESFADSPYMLLVFDVKEDKRSVIPAVTHVDGTARLQTVPNGASGGDPRYRALLEAFRDRTGVPVLLNTSFNVKGEPVVCTPEDAIRCFYTTGIDALVMGDFVLEKSPASNGRNGTPRASSGTPRAS